MRPFARASRSSVRESRLTLRRGNSRRRAPRVSGRPLPAHRALQHHSSTADSRRSHSSGSRRSSPRALVAARPPLLLLLLAERMHWRRSGSPCQIPWELLRATGATSSLPCVLPPPHCGAAWRLAARSARSAKSARSASRRGRRSARQGPPTLVSRAVPGGPRGLPAAETRPLRFTRVADRLTMQANNAIQIGGL